MPMAHTRGGVDEPQAKKAKSAVPAAFICPAAKAITFHLVSKRPGSTEETTTFDFDPEFCHQHFGEEEQIEGYMSPTVDIWVDGHSLNTWIGFKYENKLKNAQDVMGTLTEWFTGGLMPSKDEFEASLESSSSDWASFGEEVASLTTPDGRAVGLYKYHLCKADAKIKALHARLEPLLQFFIDGAQVIDQDDPHWELLLAFSQEDNRPQVLGMCTLYKWWAWPPSSRNKEDVVELPAARTVSSPQLPAASASDIPDNDNCRLRLSQMLVLPPYQGKGIGSALLHAAYKRARQKGCIDITFEEASPELQCLRLTAEARMMAALDWLLQHTEQAEASARAAFKAGKLDDAVQALVLSPEMVRRVREATGITTPEVRCAWELLLWSRAMGRTGKQAELQPVLEGLVRRRLVAHLRLKRVGERAIIEHADDERCFLMTKVCAPAGEPEAAAGGASGSGDDGEACEADKPDTVQDTADESSPGEGTEEAVEERLALLEQIARRMNAKK